MKKTLHLIALLLMTVVTVSLDTSCKKDGKKEEDKEKELVTRQVSINAGDGSVYHSLESGNTVSSSQNWDISFNKAEIVSTGGIALHGNAEGLYLDDVPFDEAIQAPESGYVKDGETFEEKVFSSWFSYDPVTHLISPNNRVYVIKTGGKKYAKLQILTYADNGTFTIKYTIQKNGSRSFVE